MKVNVGTYSKKKRVPKVYGPRRRINRKALAKKVVAERESKKKGIQRKKLILYVFITLVFVGISFGIWRFNTTSARVKYSGDGNYEICDNIFNPQCWSDKFKPNLKQTDGFTNVLIVGLDTRPIGEGSELQNTDAVLLASINHEKKKVMLISIPRDMLVDVYVDEYLCCTMKINGVYSLQEARDDVDDGLELLADNIERMLGIDIQYRASINFEAVKDGVDAVGGVEIDVPADLTILYPMSEPPYDNIYIEFEEGLQNMDGETALTWGRFRKVWVGPQEFASDFSRVKRQQEVIDALKEKALEDSGDLSAMAQKYWEIYQTISDNVDINNLDFEDVLAGVSLLSDYDTDPVNVVLDPELGGLNSIIVTGELESDFGYHILPYDGSWQVVRDYLANIWEYPRVYDEEAVVVISNKTGVAFGTDAPATEIQNSDIPLGGLALISEYADEGENGILIYDFSGGDHPATIDLLKTYFGEDIEVIDDPASVGVSQSGYIEDIKVVVAPEPLPDTSGE